MKWKFIISLFCIPFLGYFFQIKESNTVCLPNTEEVILEAKANGVVYQLYISLPKNYTSSQKNYPVMYLLDADYSFALAKNIVEHLSDRDHLEEMIIVGIAYAGEKKYRINRTRDYTPTNTSEGGYSVEIQKTYSGGGENFLNFIQGELIPFMDENYRTSTRRGIVGHSYGGLFCSWVLLTNPDIFDTYIIVSPSLWFDNHLLLDMEDNLALHDNQLKKVYLTVGDREISELHHMPQDLENFYQKLASKKLQNLDIQYEVIPDQTHNSIFPIGLSNGIRFVWDGV